MCSGQNQDWRLAEGHLRERGRTEAGSRRGYWRLGETDTRYALKSIAAKEAKVNFSEILYQTFVNGKSRLRVHM